MSPEAGAALAKCMAIADDSEMSSPDSSSRSGNFPLRFLALKSLSAYYSAVITSKDT